MGEIPVTLLEPGETDFVQAPDGTTVLVRAEIDDLGDVVVLLWCGGDDAHCDEDHWCVHTRELAEAQPDIPGRVVRVVPRRTR